MEIINGISSDPKQSFQVFLEDNTLLDCTLTFIGNNLGWYLTFKYKDVECTTPLRLTVCPNILREYKNRVPFGIGCDTTDGQEVFYIDDFTSGRAKLLLLNSADVVEVEETLYAKTI